jgi:dTDP-4-amino-4,6-dideoxygalactose transaminase
MSPESLESFFDKHTVVKDGTRYNKYTDRPVSAVVPMHTFGHPCRIQEIARICDEYSVTLVEDAAESLGSYHGGRHTGTFGKFGVFSYNGNKTITTGGGGMLVTDDEELARRAKHLTTTAKLPHPWEYVHDETGFNYRLPNINAALGCAQMERLEEILRDKRAIAQRYREFFEEQEGIRFIDEPEGTRSNFWLNALLFDDPKHKEFFLEETNAAGVMTRPVWRPMHELPMYASSYRMPLPVTKFLADRIVNIPSGARERP